MCSILPYLRPICNVEKIQKSFCTVFSQGSLIGRKRTINIKVVELSLGATILQLFLCSIATRLKLALLHEKETSQQKSYYFFMGHFRTLKKKEKSFRIVNITVVVVIKLVQKAFKGISARETAIEKTQKISRFVRYYYMQVPRGMSSIIRESFTYHQKNGKRKTKVIRW